MSVIFIKTLSGDRVNYLYNKLSMINAYFQPEGECYGMYLFTLCIDCILVGKVTNCIYPSCSIYTSMKKYKEILLQSPFIYFYGNFEVPYA